MDDGWGAFFLLLGFFAVCASGFFVGMDVGQGQACVAQCGEHWTWTEQGCVCLTVAP